MGSWSLRPRTANYHNSLGLALRGFGERDAAIDAFECAIAIDPDDPDAQNNYGLTLGDSRRYDEAVAPLRRALAIRPDYPAAQNNLGRILVWFGEYDEAVRLLQAACTVESANPNYWNSLGVALRESGDPDAALAAFEKALACDPSLIDAHVNRAHGLLAAGDFANGWREHDWRLQRPQFRQRMADRYWTGEEIAGRTILLWSEQGFGDAIQFIRYAPLVAARDARVVVECPEPLARLFAEVAGVSATVQPGATIPYDVHAPLMSLPLLLAAEPEPMPYLTVPAMPRSGDKAARRIGLVWAGNPGHANDRNRSHPLSAFAPLSFAAGADMDFVALQTGGAAGDVAPDGMVLRRPDRPFRDFAETAAAIGALDLVISVDTSVAHLAGALGKDVWVILPPNPDWRWGYRGETSPWYGTMRLFRQEWGEPRASLFDRLAEALGNWRLPDQIQVSTANREG
ncbi:MAG: tetratricopeptide repeat protein [Proteobacteria bacterium]|nr:tetratricopeptide repeat protein [Pseudomonadota bacterium]